jgi:plasmid stabilization system protein ParE
LEYLVEITDTALSDAEEYFRFLQRDRQEPEYAIHWWNGPMDALFSLESMPRRCPVIREETDLAPEVRHLIYQSHRILFTVNEDKVRVLRVYHGARRPLKA